MELRRSAKTCNNTDVALQKTCYEVGPGYEDGVLSYKRPSASPKKQTPYTLRWYFDERDMELDELRKKSQQSPV